MNTSQNAPIEQDLLIQQALLIEREGRKTKGEKY